MRKIRCVIAGTLALSLAGCGDQLVVENPNAPDQERALARPTDVENLIASSFRTVHNATLGSNTLFPQFLVMGLESYSGNANFGMAARGGIPRAAIDNNRGNQTADANFGPYSTLHQAARAAATGLGRMNRPDFTFFPASEAQRQRARAFAFFVKGVALGYIAMTYDSGAAVHESDDPQVLLPLVGYDSLMRYALAQLDSAVAIASVATAPAGANWFPLPSTWINGNALTAAQFVQLCRSYRARFRAGVARNPAERAAVGWNAVIADAQNGITANFTIRMENRAGGWFYRPAQMDLFLSWHQMWQFMVGMADTSGRYSAWLATPVAQRTPFLVVTPDRRFPQGTTRAAQQGNSPTVPTGSLFFRNRPSGQDTPGDPLAFSFYDFYRFQSYYNTNRNDVVPVMTRAEMDLLMAEGYIQTGQFALAAQRLDVSRAARGLPTLAGVVTNNTTPVPGLNACVPKVPQAPTYTAAGCGNLMEAMKWEKRMETAFTHWGAWYFDSRGWADLPENSPVHYPVPFQELDARRLTIYTYSTGAARGTYGL